MVIKEVLVSKYLVNETKGNNFISHCMLLALAVINCLEHIKDMPFFITI